jgi:hypothetical protein
VAYFGVHFDVFLANWDRFYWFIERDAMIISVISSTERVGRSIADEYPVGSSREFTRQSRGQQIASWQIFSREGMDWKAFNTVSI